MKNKKIFALFLIVFLAAACNPFKTTLSTGIIKSVDGGADWQFANKMASSTTASLSGLSIAKMAFDPSNRQTVFAGSYTGGLYKSVDSAASWSNILSKIYVYDFAISLNDSGTIYAAGFYADHGRVLKTTDGGASWNQIYNEESANNQVRAIAINPNNSSQIVIGMASGALVKSADAGATWQFANNFKDQINRILWQGNNIYVLLKTKGLYVSSGFADNFISITEPITSGSGVLKYTNINNTGNSFSQVYVDFQAPTLIYITANNGLYKTTDGGTAWTTQNLPMQPGKSSLHAIALATNNSSVVFASSGSTIYKSLDGGQNWQTQSITSGGFVNYILVDPQLPQIVYGGIYNTQQ